MTMIDVTETIAKLRRPYQQPILQHTAMGLGANLHRLAQIIVGPPASGKTTEAHAYAEALAAAKIVDKKPAVVAYAGNHQRRDEWIELFKSAEKGVLIIDEIYRLPHDSLVNDLLLNALDESKCVVILTGEADKMKKYFDEGRPELRARLPAFIETEKAFTREEMASYHQKRDEERRIREREAARLAELARSADEWRQMSEDVTLRKKITPMKGIVLRPKNETVS